MTLTLQSEGGGGMPCDHRWMSVDDLADELKIPKSTIYGWKSRGIGPTWVRVGKHLRARRTDVDAWLNNLTRGAA